MFSRPISDSTVTTNTHSGDSISYIAPGLESLGKFKPPPHGTNISYRMWQLADKGKPNKKIRSKVAGVTKEGVMVIPSVKLEHQAQYEAEQVTTSQVSREWISAIIQPGSTPTRMRVTPDSQVCMVEEKTLQ